MEKSNAQNQTVKWAYDYIIDLLCYWICEMCNKDIWKSYFDIIDKL